MDATIYEIIFGELGDLNCSLMEAFQDTFSENASLSLLSADGLYCNATTDEIGTCWPRSSSGRIVERPCPEYINGVKYNTTSKTVLSCTHPQSSICLPHHLSLR
uniref:G-protein coupled receptors family 2 profile 1 domain-containing protein n=1 Tax=Amphilophus citrinellus TaxID=61819 RepID=A0A3Q0STF9_AMPCI